VTKTPTINRRGWLALWLQKRRRSRVRGALPSLLPAPVLVAQYPSLAVWEWNYPNPARWNAYKSLDDGMTFRFDDWETGDARQYAPDGGENLMFIVGVDANGTEITERSNAVLPDDGVPPPPAPFLVSLGTVNADNTWQAIAPVAVDDWQFCTTDNAFDPQVETFDHWVYEADARDADFVVINATTATVTVNFAYCAARYRVGATWSSWTGVLDATLIPPPDAPTLVHTEGSFLGTAPVPASVWQFAQSDSKYESGPVQDWVNGADMSNGGYDLLPPNQAETGLTFTWCACRYQVDGVWSLWSAVI
jgi:hypothetical protein